MLFLAWVPEPNHFLTISCIPSYGEIVQYNREITTIIMFLQSTSSCLIFLFCKVWFLFCPNSEQNTILKHQNFLWDGNSRVELLCCLYLVTGVLPCTCDKVYSCIHTNCALLKNNLIKLIFAIQLDPSIRKNIQTIWNILPFWIWIYSYLLHLIKICLIFEVRITMSVGKHYIHFPRPLFLGKSGKCCDTSSC